MINALWLILIVPLACLAGFITSSALSASKIDSYDYNERLLWSDIHFLCALVGIDEDDLPPTHEEFNDMLRYAVEHDKEYIDKTEMINKLCITLGTEFIDEYKALATDHDLESHLDRMQTLWNTVKDMGSIITHELRNNMYLIRYFFSKGISDADLSVDEYLGEYCTSYCNLMIQMLTDRFKPIDEIITDTWKYSE